MKLLHLILVNLRRKKTRTALTVGSFTVALFLFGILMTIKSALSSGVDVAGANRLVVRNRVSLIQPLPVSYRERILQVPHVSEATFATWFGGYYKDMKDFFPNFGIDVGTYRSVFPEYKFPEDQWRAFAADREGCVISPPLAKKFGWKIGDRIPLQGTIWRGTWELNVRAIYDTDKKELITPELWFHYDYLDERRPFWKGLVGWYIVKVDDPANAVQVAATIDDRFGNSPYETKTETEKAFAAGFASQIGNIRLLILSIGSVVFFTLLLVTGNTMASAVRERTNELAVLKTIGMNDPTVLMLVMAEGIVVATIGGCAGLVLAKLFTLRGDPTGGMLPNFYFAPRSIILGLAVTIAAGAAARSSPRWAPCVQDRGRAEEGLTMAIPMEYNVRSVVTRWPSTLVAVLSIAGTVAVFIVMLAMAQGFQATLVSAGSPVNAIVLRGGANSEMMSALNLDQARVIADAPGVAHTAGGDPLASNEVVVIGAFPLASTGTDANIQIRGLSAMALQVRPNVRVVEGRFFQPGLTELVIGRNVPKTYRGLSLGSKISFGGGTWTIVGVFDAGGSSFDSEIWCDANVLDQIFKRPVNIFQSVTARLQSPDSLRAFKDALTTDPRVTVDVFRETAFYAEQSRAVSTIIRVLGFIIAVVMAVGAVFAALNTMYSAVAARSAEIATLKALGFSPASVVFSFLAESIVIAIAGGAVGSLAALPFNGFTTGTINWSSFSYLAFSFRVTTPIIASGFIFSMIMGVIGGLPPAVRAARLPIIVALREL